MSELLTTDDVAVRLGVDAATVRSYRTPSRVARTRFPQPDRMVGRTPCWHPETIDAWQRPGRGARTDRAEP